MVGISGLLKFSALFLLSVGINHAAAQSDDDGDIINCVPAGRFGKAIDNKKAEAIVDEYFRLICQSNADAPFSLKAFEGVDVTFDGLLLTFVNEEDSVATPPNCGETVDDFKKLLAKCFSGKTRSVKGNLIETAGGLGRSNYVIESLPLALEELQHA
ncbi:hypothetical protein NA57DRAFT_51957 [Rhizodiscina lignyota]|uniref:Secreted protein n=1 Tax=Rhizodiscina lignyota TaxID=1504668 RepID=A0A9P4IQG8_9PEZI|nr:hypothetical protein NA57DRAFT_51957 [Rhizodiscina lignyota]